MHVRTKAEYDRGEKLHHYQQAKEGATTTPKVEVPTLDERMFERYRTWLHGWRELARSVFTRRDHLIMLGLASRRSNSDDDDDGATDPSGSSGAA